MRGSVTKFHRRRLCGRILGEDGREVLFDRSSLDGLNTRLLSVGDRVEFQQQYEGKLSVPGKLGLPSSTNYRPDATVRVPLACDGRWVIIQRLARHTFMAALQSTDARGK